MNLIALIEMVVASDLLSRSLTYVPDYGATEQEIRIEEIAIDAPLDEELKLLLRKWNGLNLEVIRFYGCGHKCTRIARLSDSQDLGGIYSEHRIVIGSDPSGFIYMQDKSGEILSFDTDGGQLKKEASSITDFLSRLVFGPDAALFGGTDWLHELKASGLVS